MAEINPLASVGRSRDKSATQRTINEAKVAAELPGIGLKQILANQAARRKGAAANTNATRNKLIGMGLNPDDPDVMRKVAAIGKSNALQANLTGIKTGAEVGARIPNVLPGENLPMWALRGTGGASGGDIGLGPPLGAISAAGGKQTGTVAEAVQGMRPTPPGSIAAAEPVTITTTKAKTQPLTAPRYQLPSVKPRQATPPPKAASGKQARQPDKQYGSVGGQTGWWIRNPKTNGYYFEEK